MDLKRILTTVLGLPIVAAIFIFCNNYIIDILLMIIAIMCMHEYLGVIKKVSHPMELIAYLSTIIIGLSAFVAKNEIMKITVFSIPIIMLLLFLKVIITDMKITFKDAAYTLLGIIYIVGFYGQNFTNDNILQNWFTNIYLWFAIISILSFGKKYLDFNNKVTTYMTRNNFSFYVLHYEIVLLLGFVVVTYMNLPFILNYIIILLGTIIILPVVTAIIKRVPIINKLLLGTNK